MSANRNKTTSNKSYCKVCHDAGKPESMYTSHCVKTYNINTGKTVTTCPTLLALDCRYCFGKGHTVKFCPVLEENKKMDIERTRERARQERARQEQTAATPVQERRRPTNAFAVLDDDSEDETTQVTTTQYQVTTTQAKQEVDEFPALNGFAKVTQNNNVKSYSCVASTPADEKRLEISRNERKQKQEQEINIPFQERGFWVEDESEDEEEIENTHVEEESEEEELAPRYMPYTQVIAAKVTTPYAQQSFEYSSDDW
jgi:hypothetical protein